MRVCGSMPDGRLVEEEHLRLVHERAGHHQPLRETAREVEDHRVGPLGERELLEQLVGARPGARARDAEEAAVVVEVLPDRERPVERVRLRDDADLALARRRRAGSRRARRRARGPPVGTTVVVSIPIVVDLPAPFGPSSPKNSPRRTSRSSPSTATSDPYTLRSCSVRIGASPIAENVSARPRLQCASPGGVPERPKGTGCKPVGSAYGGSNPPAPTSSLRTTGIGSRRGYNPRSSPLSSAGRAPPW